MLHWISAHRILLTWLTGASIVLFVATLIIAPMIVIRIPHDYFAHPHRPRGRWADHHPVVRITLQLAKNLFGYIFIAAGLAMLVLPGQGLLTLLIGFLLIEYPGKYRVEKWLISRRRVLQAINWYRHRRNRPPLITQEAPS